MEKRRLGQTLGSKLLLLLWVTLIAGCVSAPPRQPISLDGSAFNQKIDTIHLMPVIDERNDQSIPIDAEDILRLQEKTKEILVGRGYDVVLADSWISNGSISHQRLADSTTGELAQLAPPDAHVIMIISVNDISDKYSVITASYSITATLKAIDRHREAEIWKDVATGATSGAGMLDAAFSLIGKKNAAQSSVLRIALSTFPTNKESDSSDRSN